MSRDNSVQYHKEFVINTLSTLERSGKEKLIEFLKTSDYFYAPASTKYHGAYEGGLCEHSISVMFMFQDRNCRLEVPVSKDTVIVCGLLHDLCKVGLYIKSGQGFKSVSTHPAKTQHARVSLNIIEKYIALTPLERDIILYHMGLFGCYGYCVEYAPKEMCDAIARNVAVQIFASCDNEEAHMKTL